MSLWLIFGAVIVGLALALAGLLALLRIAGEMVEIDDPHCRTSVIGRDQFVQERRAALAQQQRRAR